MSIKYVISAIMAFVFVFIPIVAMKDASLAYKIKPLMIAGAAGSAVSKQVGDLFSCEGTPVDVMKDGTYTGLHFKQEEKRALQEQLNALNKKMASLPSVRLLKCSKGDDILSQFPVPGIKNLTDRALSESFPLQNCKPPFECAVSARRFLEDVNDLVFSSGTILWDVSKEMKPDIKWSDLLNKSFSRTLIKTMGINCALYYYLFVLPHESKSDSAQHMPIKAIHKFLINDKVC